MNNENKKIKAISFPDINPISINEFKGTLKEENFTNEDLSFSNNKTESSSKISLIIKNYINYLVKNNLLPDLPNELKIVYVKDNSFFTLNNNKNNINNNSIEPHENYLYPACMSPTTNTLYLSNDLELDSNLFSKYWNKLLKSFNHSKSNTVLNYRENFNQDNQKVLEYVIGHELGHFFLQLKNKDKQLLKDNDIIKGCALNIEEAFSESFALHIMCLKNNKFEKETNNFEKINQYRVDTEKYRLRFFKQNPIEQDIIQYQEYFNRNGIDKLLDSYDFPLIYKNIPFKDNNGNIETDINKIYDRCYQLALDNNRKSIKNLLNNETFNKYGLTKIFINEMEKSLKVIGEDNTIDEIITLTHKELEGMSFSPKKILGLRDKYLNTLSSNLNQNKL